MKSDNNLYRKRINKVIEYINSNLTKSISLKELTKVANFSSFHFHRIFMFITGEIVNSFTNRVQLEKAVRLLKYSSLSITEIAFDCGFLSSSTFSRSFNNLYGPFPSRI